IHALKKLHLLVESKIDFNQVLNYCLIILEDYPFSIEQVFFTAIAYKEMDELEKSLVFFNKYYMLIETILSSGDGLSPETAMVVLNTSDEYSVINAIGFQAEMQSLTRINGKNYDIIKLFENDYNIEELYFDIDLFFGKWK
ncbi:MAG: DUF4919 domain-containing protein, partial [Rikenellaceae bacterium]|nr:DUF4919 domain-containing protein [Rikenellaceae bacterium]